MNEIAEIPKDIKSEFLKSDSKRKHILMPKAIRTTTIVLMFAFLIAAGGYWYLLESHQKYVDVTSSVYSYSSNADLAYNVFYLENPIVTDKSVGEDKAYITSLIDYIDTVINYQFVGDKSANINITYSATACLQGVIGGLNEDSVLWSKTYEFLPQQQFSDNNKYATINFEIPISLDEITRYANQVRTALNISSDTTLTVLYNISIDSATDKGVVHEELAPSLVIPISERYFKITKNVFDKKTGTIDETVRSVSPLYDPMRMVCWVLMGLLVLALSFILIFTRNLALTPQQKKVDQLFKKYGSRIVVLSSDIKIGSKELIEVSAFDGLIRTADDLGKPVFYKNNGDGDAYCNFYVLDDCTTFIYNPWNT